MNPKAPNTKRPKPPRRQPRFTAAEIIEACEGSRGVLAVVARKLGCDRDTVDRARHRWPEVERALVASKEHVIDLLEIKMYDKAIKDGDITALKYMLNTHGKSRGYGQKQEPTEDVTEIIVDIGGE